MTHSRDRPVNLAKETGLLLHDIVSLGVRNDLGHFLADASPKKHCQNQENAWF